MLSKTKKLIPLAAYFLPLLMFAQSQTGIGLDSVAETINDILRWIAPIVIALAVIYFLVGVFKYVMAAGDDEAKGAGRSMMIYGVIGIFVMVSVWGLVNLLVNTFGLDTSNVPPPPAIPGGSAPSVR
ncbi:MAG: hypothetical protein HY481_01360 [Candidatus Vogelbacteria bacterium]|nr:hypothetical protein [Candidatus Vogelbacteria bacterium]